MQCFIVGAPAVEGRPALDGVLRELGLTSAVFPDIETLVADTRFGAGANQLVLLAGSSTSDGSAAVEFARDWGSRSFVVYLADTIAPETYKQLVRTGNAEWVAWPGDADEIRDIVTRTDLTVRKRDAARMVSFLPSKGGVGNTTLTIEAAASLAAGRNRRGSRVAVLDLNLQGGTLADALDVEPRFDIAEIVERPERLDEHLVDAFTSRHSKTLDVFAIPPSRIALDSVRPETIFTVIDAIAHRYDHLLFDLPPVWLSWTDALLAGSDAVVVSGGERVPALRRLAASLVRLDGLGIDARKVATAVIAVQCDILGRAARRTLIEGALPGRRLFLMRRDDKIAAEGLDVGQPLLDCAPNSRMVRDLRPLAEWLSGVVVQPEAAGAKRRARAAA